MEGLHAVVVIFHPDVSKLDNLISAISCDVDRVWLIDNGGDFLISNLIGSKKIQNLELISPGVNIGVAKALNIGVENGLRMGGKYIITFDQDSDVGCGMLAALLSVAKNLESKGVLYAAISPRYYDVNSGRYMPFYNIVKGRMTQVKGFVNDDVVPVLTTITSGTLYRASVFKDVGYFEDELFIDHVDHEWCFRSSCKGYLTYCCWGQTLHHRIGELSRNESIFGRRLKIHSPIRNYYYFRNSIDLMYRNYIPLAWKLMIFMDLAKKTLAILLFWDSRASRVAMMVEGVSHGLRRKLGRFSG